MTASSVSRALRRGGLLPVPPGREGVLVTGPGDPVYVRLGFDSDAAVARARQAVEEILDAAGYSVRAVSDRVLAVTQTEEV